jgi:hypothetical protein
MNSAVAARRERQAAAWIHPQVPDIVPQNLGIGYDVHHTFVAPASFFEAGGP